MTLAAPERPSTALENRRIKARAIALYLWRLGLTVEEIRGLPYASRTPSVPTMSKLARAAFAASPRPEAREKDPPDGRGSQTWTIAEEKLAEIEAMAHRGETVPERDLFAERGLWLAVRCSESPTGCPDPGRTPKCSECLRYSDDEPAAATQADVEAEVADLLSETAAAPRAAEPEERATFEALLGAACPGCGWRRGLHRPAILGWLDACPSAR